MKRSKEISVHVKEMLIIGMIESGHAVKMIDDPSSLNTMDLSEYLGEMGNKPVGEMIDESDLFFTDEAGNIILWQDHRSITLMDEDGVDIENCTLSFLLDRKTNNVIISLLLESNPLEVARIMQRDLLEAKIRVQRLAPWIGKSLDQD